MIRTVVGLLLILATAGAQIVEGNCAKDIPLVEYVRVLGTQNLTIVQQGKFDLTLYKTFPLTGERLIGYKLTDYPGFIESISAEVHYGGYDDEGFPRLFPQVERTNQLVPSKFEYAIKGFQSVQQLNAKAPVLFLEEVSLSPETFVRNWVLSLHITTVMENGKPHKLWGEGTQFQRFRTGASEDKIQHNGFVIENPCELPVVEFCSASNSYEQRADGTYVVDSGLPATFPTPLDSVCEWNIPMTTYKKDLSVSQYVTIITYANLGDHSSFTISFTGESSNAVGLAGGVTNAVAFESPVLPYIRYTTGAEPEMGPIFGFRARIVPLNTPVGSCFKPEDTLGAAAACHKANILGCVLATKPECAASYDVECAATADLCDAFYEAGLQDYYQSSTWSPAAAAEKRAHNVDLKQFKLYNTLQQIKNKQKK